MPKKKAKKVPYVWCHYRGAWVPMGRATKKCPACSAHITKGEGGHRIKRAAAK